MRQPTVGQMWMSTWDVACPMRNAAHVFSTLSGAQLERSMRSQMGEPAQYASAPTLGAWGGDAVLRVFLCPPCLHEAKTGPCARLLSGSPGRHDAQAPRRAR